MAESSGCVLIHYPRVGAECDLLPLVGVVQDGDPVQALGFVELVNHILPLILKVHLGEYHHDQGVSLVPV